MCGLMWIILERWLKVLEFFIILSLIFILFQWWIYNDKRAFKKYVLSDFKGKSKFFIFMYKFSALTYFEGFPAGGSMINIHAYKNIEIFGKQYMRITHLCVILSILSSVLLSTVLIIEYYIWNTNNLILDIDNNKISVTYSAGELTKIRWVKGKKYNIEINGNNDKNKFTIILDQKDKEIKLKSNIEIGYFKEYDNKIASITTGNKKIKTFSIKEYKTYLKKSILRSKNFFKYGLFSLLLLLLMLWIRYKKYGFKGIDKLIAIKKEEFTKKQFNN